MGQRERQGDRSGRERERETKKGERQEYVRERDRSERKGERQGWERER